MAQKLTSDLCKAISLATNNIILALQKSSNHMSLSKRQNFYGEDVKPLDQLANDIIIEELGKSPHIAGVASEELDEPIFFDKNKSAKYVAVVDPLDGSSNVNLQITVGTIFGFYEIKGNLPCKEDFLQPGHKLVLAGYTVFGPATTMVISDGTKVSEFFLKDNNFVLHRDNITCPPSGKWLSVNACNYNKWDPNHILWLFDNLHKYSHRYIGTLVADFHRTLIEGGIFAYPENVDKKAKLRLLYECNPLAFIMKAAGGKSISSYQDKDILDINPQDLHDCTGFFTGSQQEIKIVKNYSCKVD